LVVSIRYSILRVYGTFKVLFLNQNDGYGNL